LEKRDNKRKKLRLLVQADPGAFRAVTADISKTGMFLVSTKTFAPGTKVRLTIKTNDGVALGVGVVRWAKRVPQVLIRHARGGMGIEFTWVSPELQEVLDGIL
jgi:c-di-GMP-binding flagellar brake protein YcgR